MNRCKNCKFSYPLYTSNIKGYSRIEKNTLNEMETIDAGQRRASSASTCDLVASTEKQTQIFWYIYYV